MSHLQNISRHSWNGYVTFTKHQQTLMKWLCHIYKTSADTHGVSRGLKGGIRFYGHVFLILKYFMFGSQTNMHISRHSWNDYVTFTKHQQTLMEWLCHIYKTSADTHGMVMSHLQNISRHSWSVKGVKGGYTFYGHVFLILKYFMFGSQTNMHISRHSWNDYVTFTKHQQTLMEWLCHIYKTSADTHGMVMSHLQNISRHSWNDYVTFTKHSDPTMVIMVSVFLKYKHEENMFVKCIRPSSPVFSREKKLGFAGIFLIFFLFLIQNIHCVYS